MFASSAVITIPSPDTRRKLHRLCLVRLMPNGLESLASAKSVGAGVYWLSSLHRRISISVPGGYISIHVQTNSDADSGSDSMDFVRVAREKTL